MFSNTSDTQVNFTGETELDNGVTVAVEINKEAERTSVTNRNADQQFLTLTGAFGEITMGERLIVADRIHNAAPRYGIGYDLLSTGDGVVAGAVAFTGTIAPASYAATSLDALVGAGAMKLEYVTPEFMGFNLGFSYTPNVGGNRNLANEFTTMHDAIAGGVAYAAEYESGVSVSADFAIARAEHAANNGVGEGYTVGYDTGLNIGFAGFTIGGSYMQILENFNRQNAAGTGDAGARTNAGNVYDIGIGYETEEGIGIAVTYYHENKEEDTTTRNKDQTKHLILSGKYDLGPGVAYQASIGQSDYKNAARTDAGSTKSTYYINGITLEF
jgi:hypothetical protein